MGIYQMENPVESYVSDGEQRRVFWSALRLVKGFFSWLIQWVSLTEEDLMEAGVYLHPKRE